MWCGQPRPRHYLPCKSTQIVLVEVTLPDWYIHPVMQPAATIIPPRRSLAFFASLAMLMVVVSYFFILLLAIACVYLPWLVVTDVANFQTLALFVAGVIVAGSMLWSMVPQRDKFTVPGLALKRGSHPRLFAELDRIASSLQEPMPREVYLIGEPNAWVARSWRADGIWKPPRDGARTAAAGRAQHFTVSGHPRPRICSLLRRRHEAGPLAPQYSYGDDPDLREHGVGGESDAGCAHAGFVRSGFWDSQVVLAVVSARHQFCFPVAGIPRR